MMLAVIMTAGSAMAAITDGLISYWPLDEGSGAVANDAFGSNTGTIHGGAAWDTGKFGSCVVFDGVDKGNVGSTTTDYIDCGSNASLKPANVSVSAWVKFDAYPYYGQIAGMAHDSGTEESGYSILADSSYIVANGFGAWISGSDGDGNYSGQVGPAAPIGWTHVATTYDGTTTTLYLNGVGTTSTAESGNLSYAYVTTFKIGLYAANAWWLPYAGLIDDVGVWDRALSSVEIGQLYNSGDGMPILGGGAGSVQITEIGGFTEVTEGGPADTYEVVLGSEPTHSVQVTATPSDAQIDLGLGAGVAKTLTFTVSGPDRWEIPQTITVTAYDDEVYERPTDPHTTTIDHTSTSTDDDYDDLYITQVSVDVYDDELICGDWGYLRSDINRDCWVNLQDLVELAIKWLE